MNFDTEIAKLVGTDAAIIYSNIEYWVEHNRVNNTHFYEDNFWTYNSVDAFSKLFDYLSKSQIKTCLIKLEKAELIIIGNFNKLGYDRTKWYSIPLKSTIGDFSPMHLSEIANPLDENRQPIPYYKPNDKTNNTIVDFEKLLNYFNNVYKKKTRVFSKDAKANINQRIKEGYSKEDIQTVIDNASNDNHHIESNYKYITLEFLSRPKIFERYASQQHQKPYSVKKEQGHTNH